jgi:cytochrome c553
MKIQRFRQQFDDSHGAAMHAMSVAAMVAGAFIVAPLARAADADAGRQLVETQCAACHGKDAKSPVDPSYPKLAGQYDDYLRKVLLDYKSGARKNAIMAGISKALSNQDIANLSAYLSGLPGPLTHRGR